MTNIEYIKSLDIRQLAELLVQCDHEEEYEYDWDEEPYFWDLQNIYRTSDGEEYGDFEDAVEHEEWWLKQEHTPGGPPVQGRP